MHHGRFQGPLGYLRFFGGNMGVGLDAFLGFFQRTACSPHSESLLTSEIEPEVGLSFRPCPPETLEVQETLENSREIPLKTRNKTTIGPSNPATGHVPQGNQN